jgi:hypothetical protein
VTASARAAVDAAVESGPIAAVFTEPLNHARTPRG